jgi:ABC-type amino acid transport substrate-binding protein
VIRIASALAVGLALALTAAERAAAQARAGAHAAAAPAAISLDVLKGSWVRPDGGYTIAIRDIGPDGRLDAMYFNPGALPFATAQAGKDGSRVRAFFELRAGGYGGSTYELTYDPADDRLKGVYFQAVARQRYEVTFVRKPVAGAK